MDLWLEQEKIEIAMVDRGVARYRRMVEDALHHGEATRARSVSTALDSAVVSLTAALVAFIGTTGAGRRHVALPYLKSIAPDVAALVTLRVVLDGISRDRPATPIAIYIGRLLEIEVRMARLEAEKPAYVKRLVADLDGRTNHAAHRRAVLAKALRTHGGEWTPWAESMCLRIGMKMLELVIEGTGLFTLSNPKKGKSNPVRLLATERFRDWIATLDARFQLTDPEYLPCVIPPVDWTSPTSGGYHTGVLVNPPTLVKTRSREHGAALDKADLGHVMRAVNAIQSTAWRVNERVLSVMEALTEEGRAVGGIPQLANEPVPTKPADIAENEAARGEWKRLAAAVYTHNRRQTGRRLNFLRTIHMARDFAHYPAIYFPHQLDFRGRVYPIAQGGLQPQGNDISKALLYFAEGDALGTQEGVDWFLAHGANCAGVDKVSFEDRRAWVFENAENIIRSAEDPLGFQWWAGMDSPYCFLAWAFEFAQWTAEGCTLAFVSSIPVAMDGSCNGLQHYSAMLRDPRGGKATNLMPSGKPQDIYKEVADVTMRKLAEGAAQGGEMAQWAAQWAAYGITRQITKRAVMVLPYGGTQKSCHDYVLEAIEASGNMPPFELEETHAAVRYLSATVWAAIGEVVIAARLAMGWLRAMASAKGAQGGALLWTAPSGFPIMQAYPQMQSAQIYCTVFGKRFRPSLDMAHEILLDARRQTNGVAPNFVHGLDASALVLAVCEALLAGLNKFAMIHDSYGTTAARAAALARALRTAFVKMYEEHDVLEEFLRDVGPTVAPKKLAKVPAIPHVGGLDLSVIHESRYFFA